MQALYLIITRTYGVSILESRYIYVRMICSSPPLLRQGEEQSYFESKKQEDGPLI